MKKTMTALFTLGIAATVFAAANGYFQRNSDGTIDVIASKAILSGGLVTTPGTASVTNGATLTPTAAVMVVSGIGGANDTTNTITLASATTGQSLTIVVASTSSNLVSIADSGNAALSGAWVGDNNDVITLVGVGTSWVQTGESNN